MERQVEVRSFPLRNNSTTLNNIITGRRKPLHRFVGRVPPIYLEQQEPLDV